MFHCPWYSLQKCLSFIISAKIECTFLCMPSLAHLWTALVLTLYKFCDTEGCDGWRNKKSTSDVHCLTYISVSSLCVLLNERISFFNGSICEVVGWPKWSLLALFVLLLLNLCTNWNTFLLHLCIIHFSLYYAGILLWNLQCSAPSDHKVKWWHFGWQCWIPEVERACSHWFYKSHSM